MSARLLPAILILVAMLAAPTLAGVLRPTIRIADQGPKVDLDAMVPRAFGDWRTADAGSLVLADPQRNAVVDRIYAQTLARTYINSDGYRIMLSIAYGGDQSDSMQVHKPEICYPAQGFTLWEVHTGTLTTTAGPIPVKRLVTSQGQRHEPVTYWTTIGDKAVAGGLQKKLIEMKYGLTGTIPDGLLFRVSSIDGDQVSAYVVHERFVDDLLKATSPEARKRLSGLGS
jgi:EpsI family protein